MSGEINYNLLVEKALQGVVKESLSHVAKHGLVGQQHFYVTFKTNNPGVDIPNHLKEKYEDEMTIVLQHQFWDLTVEEDYFSIGLSFNHQRETLIVPFNAITAFADPSVQFGLQFTLLDEVSEETVSEITKSDMESEAAEDNDDKEEKAGEVITLDAFRNK